VFLCYRNDLSLTKLWPTWLTQPKITSSTNAGSKPPGILSNTRLLTTAALSARIEAQVSNSSSKYLSQQVSPCQRKRNQWFSNNVKWQRQYFSQVMQVNLPEFCGMNVWDTAAIAASSSASAGYNERTVSHFWWCCEVSVFHFIDELALQGMVRAVTYGIVWGQHKIRYLRIALKENPGASWLAGFLDWRLRVKLKERRNQHYGDGKKARRSSYPVRRGIQLGARSEARREDTRTNTNPKGTSTTYLAYFLQHLSSSSSLGAGGGLYLS